VKISPALGLLLLSVLLTLPLVAAQGFVLSPDVAQCDISLVGALPTILTVQGTGFTGWNTHEAYPPSSVMLAISVIIWMPFRTTEPQPFTVDDSGHFTVQVPMPDMPKGTFPVIAQEFQGNQVVCKAYTYFTV
jgi:hypothetical protein